jgi:hypothetical protein
MTGSSAFPRAAGEVPGLSLSNGCGKATDEGQSEIAKRRKIKKRRQSNRKVAADIPFVDEDPSMHLGKECFNTFENKVIKA